MKIFLIVILIVILLDLIVVDWLTRYSCDRKCPKLPSFISQGLTGKGKKKTNKKSES